MDVVVKLPGLQEDEAQESHLLLEKGACCLSKIRSIGEPLGISCQQVFERAYARVGIAGTRARAIFAQYLAFEGKGPLPANVKQYSDLVTEKGYEARSGKEGFCAGCMLNGKGVYGFIAAYDLIESVDLLQESKVLVSGPAPISTIDNLYMDLLDSGALSQQNEDWQDVLDINFEDPDSFET